ncbi:MAG: hypothetical protein AAFY47_05275 [Pseudomonadota bacterium]
MIKPCEMLSRYAAETLQDKALRLAVAARALSGGAVGADDVKAIKAALIDVERADTIAFGAPSREAFALAGIARVWVRDLTIGETGSITDDPRPQLRKALGYLAADVINLYGRNGARHGV